jgi:hydrogenase-4 component F
MIWALLLVPTLAGLLAFVVPGHGVRRALLLVAAVTHAGLTAAAWVRPAPPAIAGWMALDAAALLFLSIVSLLFLAVAIYAVGYLRQEQRLNTHADFEEGPLFTNSPEATFTACLLLFLATMTLVLVSRHWGLMWVAVEATTLASAPLVYFHRHHRSLEATWKYLLICSVGIALALLGNFFLAVATHGIAGEPLRLTIDELQAQAAALDPRWLKAAFLLLLVGYGTKMGLAPFHTWLPDAHSEAPSVVSALLSGALLNCALLPILRLHGVLVAASLAPFSQELLIFFGLFSMGVAAVFILGQADFKRMLAYSSVEHMGVLAFGIGVGGLAGFGTMLHAVGHSLTKAMLFLAAGNLLAVYRTKSTTGTAGILEQLPLTGLLWVGGFLAICGSPPFSLFLSELTILQGAIGTGHYWAAVGYLAALAAIFVGMASIVLRMAYGPRPASPGHSDTLPATRTAEPLWSIAPPAMLGVMVLLFGVYVPPALGDVLRQAAAVVGAQ